MLPLPQSSRVFLFIFFLLLRKQERDRKNVKEYNTEKEIKYSRKNKFQKRRNTHFVTFRLYIRCCDELKWTKKNATTNTQKHIIAWPWDTSFSHIYEIYFSIMIFFYFSFFRSEITKKKYTKMDIRIIFFRRTLNFLTIKENFVFKRFCANFLLSCAQK